MREAEIMTGLNNKNVIKLLDYFIENGNIYLVTEFCEKGDLFDYTHKAISLSKSKTWKFLIEMCIGLSYIHEQGIIHCDLKPQNVFVGRDSCVRIGDLSSAIVSRKTNHFSVCYGTPCYTAPEVYAKQNFSHKADIWSLGCILYELCTRRKAFDSNNVEMLKEKVINGKPPKIQYNCDGLSKNKSSLLSSVKSKIQLNSAFSDFDQDIEDIYLW